MSEAGHDESILPTVTEEDIEVVQFEDLTDPKHYIRWLEFARYNPLLAKDLLKRASDRMALAPNEAERIKIAIDLATYAVRAIEIAMERQLSDGAGDGGGPQPSA